MQEALALETALAEAVAKKKAEKKKKPPPEEGEEGERPDTAG